MAPTYHRAASLEEATALLAEHGDEAKVLGGGQSFSPTNSHGLARPGLLVDIGAVSGLDRVEVGDALCVGPLVRQSELGPPPPPVERAPPLLRRAASHVGHGRSAIEARSSAASRTANS